MPTTLENRDRFMVGRSFIFKLVIPLMAQLAKSEHQEENTVLADHLGEIMVEIKHLLKSKISHE